MKERLAVPPPTYQHDTRLGATEYVRSDERERRIAAGRSEQDTAVNSVIDLDFLRSVTKHAQEYPKSELAQQNLINAVEYVHDNLRLVNIEPTNIPDKELLPTLEAKYTRTSEKAELLRPQIEKHVKKFTEQMVEIARSQKAFPLSEIQVRERVDAMAIQIGDAFTMNGSHASFFGSRKILEVNADTVDHLKKSIYHELWHAMAGIRTIDGGHQYLNGISTVNSGFQNGAKVSTASGTSMDEGFVDMMAIATAKGIKINFGARGLRARTQWARLYTTALKDGSLSYTDELKVLFNHISFLDAPVVFNRYLKSDFDVHEPDRLAGTHAKREFQRALRILGGVKRIKEFKLADRVISGKRRGEEAGKDADSVLKQTEKTYSSDYGIIGPVRRARNKMHLAKHIKRRQFGIEAVKQKRHELHAIDKA